MEQTMKEKFRVIGACVKMQTASLEEAIKLIDGVPYNIDFFQNFSTVCIDGRPIENIPVGEIIESILNSESETITYAAYDNTPSWESYQREQDFWEAVDKFEKKERKRDRKWKKDSKKRHKRAEHFWNEIDSW